MPQAKSKEENQPMTKTDLTRSIATQMNIHTKDAETFLTTFTDTVGDSLASGEPVRLAGFGVIDVITHFMFYI